MSFEASVGGQVSGSRPKPGSGPPNRFFGLNLDLDLAKHLQSSLLVSPPFNRPPPPVTPMKSLAENPYFKFYTQAFDQSLPSGPSSPFGGSCWSSNASGSPTARSDPFMRGEVPLEMNVLEEAGPANESKSQERQFTISETQGPLPYLPRNIRHKVLFNYCVFCKNNGEDQRFYLSHTLKDINGCVTCPILYDYVCPICGATGRISHTIRYCPRNRDRKAEDELMPISVLKQMKSAAGGMSFNARRAALAGQGSSPRPFRGRRPCSQGPNAAWTGLTTQPSITPMPGDMVNNRKREETKLSRSPLP